MYDERFIDLLDSVSPGKKFIRPSEWNEKNRTLSAAYSSKPGKFSFKWAPYFREVIDNFSPDSPIQFVSVLKPVQFGYTQTVLEGLIGYYIDILPRTIIYATADRELAIENTDSRIQSMIQSTGIQHKIKSSNKRIGSKKSGDTRGKKEFEGGTLYAVGAQNPNKMRQVSAPVVLADEVDAWPLTTRQGNPIDLLIDRTDAFSNDRKLLFGSTCLISATSHILKLIELGDKRYYEVPCPRCGCMMFLFWRGDIIDGKYVNDEIYNIKYELDGLGHVYPESIYYKCRNCEGKIFDHEKFEMLQSGVWIPTQDPVNELYRSYCINGLYSLFTNWEKIVNKWLITKKNPASLQTFINNVCAEGWEDIVKTVNHRKIFKENRRNYSPFIVPNKCTIADGNSKILVLTCAVDVNQKNSWLGVEIIGTCLNGQEYVIAKGKIHGGLEENGSAWDALKMIVENVYVSDDPDPIEYDIAITGLDCGYRRDEVFAFCMNNNYCVPLRGYQSITGEKKHKKVIVDGMKVFNIDTRYYKIQLLEHLNYDWAGRPQKQPNCFINFPNNTDIGGFEHLNLHTLFDVLLSGEGFTEKFFLTYESEAPVLIELPDGQKAVKGFKRVKDDMNHFLDTHVYNKALLEIYMRIVCDTINIERMDKWSMLSFFHKHLEKEKHPYCIDYFEI